MHLLSPMTLNWCVGFMFSGFSPQPNHFVACLLLASERSDISHVQYQGMTCGAHIFN